MGREPKIPLMTAISAYFGYGMLMFLGHIRDFIGSFFKAKKYRAPAGYAPIVNDFEDFYTRRLYARIHDCWNRPISSAPGAYIDIMERNQLVYGQPLELSGTTRRCLNLGSYNYLGFGDPDSPCKPDIFNSLDNFPINTCSPRALVGTSTIHALAERTVAHYVGKEAALVFGMGFGTNSTVPPALIGKEGLIISDSHNHSSIAVGARSSGATIKVFKHNDPKHLESVIRRAIIEGQPRSHRPWRKILIMVEGIYSMEGEMCPLREIVALKKKYGAYLYLDEAHSIGAIGKTGRGICEHQGISPADIDIMMGTFTKSFGAVGGYIAADKDIIDYLRHTCAGYVYSASISIPACQQVISAMKIMLGEDGTNIGHNKLITLRDNANYFRKRLQDMGAHVLGDVDSPIVPLLIYAPSKIAALSRKLYDAGIAIVVVGFPATSLLLARTRFCLSAAHTRKDLDMALEVIRDACIWVGLLFEEKTLL